MNLLLDSHTFLWFVWDDPKLSPTARRGSKTLRIEVLERSDLWEIAIKAGLKKLALGEPATTFLPRELATNGFGLWGSSWLMRRSCRRCRRTTKTRSIACWSLRR